MMRIGIARPRAARPRARAFAAAFAAVAICGLGVIAAPERTAGVLRERAVDAALGLLERPGSDAVVVVDVDQASLKQIGPWPWPRTRIADLIAGVAAFGPKAIAIDILLEGPDRGSPAALRHAFAGAASDPALAAVLDALPEPDVRLADAIGAAPVVLAALLDFAPAAVPATGVLAPIALTGPPPRLHPWTAAGVAAPHAPLASAAAEVAVASLAAGVDGRIRAAPAFAAVGRDVYAGLALASLRTGEGAAAYILSAGRLRVGPHTLPLPTGADIRFRPTGPERWRARSIPAADVLTGRVSAARLAGRIALVGGSAPALGALRATAASPIAPSVQIHADAVETLLSGRIPVRPDSGWRVELAGAAGLALAGAAAGAFGGPAFAALVGLSAAAFWAAGAFAALALQDLVIDPATPALAALVAAGAAGLVAAIETRRSAAAVRRRFERHLDPAVVARIVRNPGLLKLTGERREVTALFTDVEGFTATAEAHDPEVVVDLLDRYFAGVTALVTAHGGMVDKIVGDAVHALFNAPVDLANHPDAAVRCALAIVRFAEDFGRRPDIAALGFGRTRVGVETGPAVVGDVGSAQKLDYTAHGAAVNTASRLEALNKVLGTSVCVGPVCRSRASGVAFRALGDADVRGQGRLAVFEPIQT